MQSKTLKFIIYLIIVLLIIMLPNLAKADTEGAVSGADKFIEEANGSPIKQSGLEEASDTLYNTLLAVGIVAAMVMATALGIKFMIGSTSEKAEVKKVAVPFVAGCIIIFGGFTIWKIIVILMKEF